MRCQVGLQLPESFLEAPEAALKGAYSGGWQIGAGCWREPSILYDMDISMGLLDGVNDPRESKREAALPQNLTFQVTLQHCRISSRLPRSALFNVGWTTQGHK